ncbi:MAG: HPr family phosphocarrier protein [Bacillota bacterium]|uniref:Phosphocarrier protein n=2 Tax=Carboxydocella TaxID=178898 RepID=A0A1T4Q6C7_9FIRM|nr:MULTISPECIES: HPr family phosphocarrier protein [Carboxydocella]AVX21186.1 phosphocarrier protein HPr/phosphocarrier protein [Carboxydocella thermautotrophica]AVX31621.1 phosphocarrier protein HPr/phosphocarrier protein [Carboxydocella thermautotrophica]SJZ99312.1 phosphocarrier protein [Carboxydocella sporoproducens DSM 16521]GAW29232.1 serine kinase [Carboxydocella sp. ULO1]GAW30260.1 serine kinase [Carboxydocella sp. JDF658]
MYAREVELQNASGLHVRPAQLLIETAGRFTSRITVKTASGHQADARSILGVMALGLSKGDKITIEAEGDDEQAAVEALVQLIESKFGEE